MEPLKLVNIRWIPKILHDPKYGTTVYQGDAECLVSTVGGAVCNPGDV